MTRRPRFLPPALQKPDRPAGPSWLIRAIAIVAVAVVVVALAVSLATGTLFTTPVSR